MRSEPIGCASWPCDKHRGRDSGRERKGLWLSAAALLMLLAVAVLGVAVTLVDPNDYKPQIVAAVQQATGRALSLGGPLRISRSLWPTIEVTDVTLPTCPAARAPTWPGQNALRRSCPCPRCRAAASR
jgi:AsmA family